MSMPQKLEMPAGVAIKTRVHNAKLEFRVRCAGEPAWKCACKCINASSGSRPSNLPAGERGYAESRVRKLLRQCRIWISVASSCS